MFSLYVFRSTKFINKINEKCFNIISQFLSIREVNIILKRVCKHINSCVNLATDTDTSLQLKDWDIEKLLAMLTTITKDEKVIKLPKNITIKKLEWNSAQLCKLIEKKIFEQRNITFTNCGVSNWKGLLPETIKNLSWIWSENDEEDFDLIPFVREIKNSSVKTLTIVLKNNHKFAEDDITNIFKSSVENITLSSYGRSNIKKCSLKELMANKTIKTLDLTNFKFDSSCGKFMSSSEFEQKDLMLLNLTKLRLAVCNIDYNIFMKMITPSLKILSLCDTKLNFEEGYDSNRLVEELSNLKEKNLLDLTHLTMINLPIKQECLPFLNKLDLEHLNISLNRIGTLENLNLPKLKVLHVNSCNLTDDTIDNALTNSLVELYVERNSKITNTTLEKINEKKTKLEKLSLYDTKVTSRGILEHLSGMKLKHLSFNPIKHEDKEKLRKTLIDANVITEKSILKI